MALWNKDRRPPAQEALFDPTKIDLVAISPDGSCVEVIVVNDIPWTGSDAQIASLQDKVHNYVGFVADGHMVTAYPETAGMPWRIVIADKAGPLDPRSADIVALLGVRVREYGGDLVVR